MDAADASAAQPHTQSRRAGGETPAGTLGWSLAEAQEEIKAELRENELAAVWTQISVLRAELQALREGKPQTHAHKDGGHVEAGTARLGLDVEPAPAPQLQEYVCGEGFGPAPPYDYDASFTFQNVSVNGVLAMSSAPLAVMMPPTVPMAPASSVPGLVSRPQDSNSSTPLPPLRRSLNPAAPEHLLPPEHSPKRGGGDENDDEEEVELEGSMWHSALFVFTPVCGVGASAVCVFLLAINLLVQGVFCFIVMVSLSIPNITPATVEHLKNWRRSSAHDFSNYNTVLGKSMAARVCAQDGALDMSASQSSMYTNLKSYIGEGDASFFGASGPTMTTLALFMWLLTVLREINETWTVTAAVLRKRSGGGGTLVTKDTNGGPEIEQLGDVRCACCCLVSLFRLVIAGVLGYWGSLFLINYSITLGDLLLNAVALEFVMSVDETVFNVLAPAAVKRLFPHHFGLTSKRAADFHGMDARTLLSLTVSLAALAALVAAHLMPLMQVLVNARDALCGGDIDFVYAVDGLGVLAWAYPTGVNLSALASRNYPDGSDPTRAEEVLNVSPPQVNVCVRARVYTHTHYDEIQK